MAWPVVGMEHDEHLEDRTSHQCGGCTLQDALHAPAAVERRQFLRAAGMALASLGFLGLGAAPAGAAELPAVEMIAPLEDREESAGGLRHYAVPAADGVSIDKDNSVIIARAGGRIYAFSLACPHQNTALRWNDRDHEFLCPKHKSRYRPDGTFIRGRATRAMDRLPIRREGGDLVVDVDTAYQQDEQPAEWAGAYVSV